jgi:hypothetical protein
LSFQFADAWQPEKLPKTGDVDNRTGTRNLQTYRLASGSSGNNANENNRQGYGEFMLTMIDYEIAHIRRVMRPSLAGDFGGPILPVRYWRERLHKLLDGTHLTKDQLRAVDALLLVLDQHDRT